MTFSPATAAKEHQSAHWVIHLVNLKDYFVCIIHSEFDGSLLNLPELQNINKDISEGLSQEL